VAAREAACERRVMRMVAVVSLVAALGCSTSKPATAPMPQNKPAPVAEAEPTPAPPPSSLTAEQLETMMVKAVAMFNAMGAATDAAGADCGKLTDALNAVLDDNASIVAEIKRFENDEDVKQRGEAWVKDHMEEVMAPLMKIATAGQRCASDAKFQAFQQRFDDAM